MLQCLDDGAIGLAAETANEAREPLVLVILSRQACRP